MTEIALLDSEGRIKQVEQSKAAAMGTSLLWTEVVTVVTTKTGYSQKRPVRTTMVMINHEVNNKYNAFPKVFK